MRRFWLLWAIAILFPYVTTIALSQGGNTVYENRNVRNKVEAGRGRIYLDRQKKGYVDLEEYLVGVVAKQIPADYEEEALKAQAVIARTYLYRQMGERQEMAESELALEYLEEEQMEKLWGNPKFLEYYQKICKAVEDTKGEVMVWKGEYIEPLFHRASAGRTRDGDEAHPYLAGKESREDLEAEDYVTVDIWTAEDFVRIIGGISGGENLTLDQVPESIQVLGRGKAGYVTEIQIGSHIFDGESVRLALNLPSSAYTLEGYEENVRAVSKGQGHGYGLSQYGANKKAAAGMKAEEILAYYYQNIQIIWEEK